MSEKRIMDLYELLPSIYRIRDAEQGYKLRSLLEIISEQADILKRDIDGLWDDLFIETCRDWVIPYIADLVANNPLNEVAARRRADVAKTIYYRRRKGTLSMLEELARDVTGWGVHVVPFFELLGWTQNLNNFRYSFTSDPVQLEPVHDPFAVDRVGSVNLRNRNALDLLNGPLDIISHTVDVRAISRSEGWYNIRKIGFFLWRLRSYPMIGVKARKSSSCKYYGFHFSPLGNPSPLFTKPRPEFGEDGLCREINTPGPIRPLAFYFDNEDYYVSQDGEDHLKSQKSIAIYCGHDIKSAKLVTIDKVACKDLSNWALPPQGMTVAVDLRLGRITFAKDPGEVFVCYSYGFSADIGGGSYERRNSLAEAEKYEWEITVCKNVDASDKTIKCRASTLKQALKDWADSAKGNFRSAIITIADSSTYEEAISNTVIPEGKSLVIRAANQMRPHIRLKGDNNLPGIFKINGKSGSKLALNGLLIEGGINLNENIEYVTIEHCTLVPGLSLGEGGKPLHPESPSVSVHKDNLKLSIEIDHCISGALNLPASVTCLTVKDSIIDACDHDRYAIYFAESTLHSNPQDHGPGPSTKLERATIFGSVHVKELKLASDTIFMEPTVADKQQAGCVRFSYLPEGSKTPRRYRCQSDLALEKRAKDLGKDQSHRESEEIKEQMRPSFTSVHYGDPGYAQLSLNCAKEIRTGAEDGSEMGAFCSLKQPQREDNLRIRLEEYLPFGLEAGFIYVT